MTKTYTGLPRASVTYELRLVKSVPFIILYDEDKIDTRSIINDAEAVVRDILNILPGAKSSVIIYRDLEGCYDFLVPDLHSDRVWHKSICALSAEGAISWWFRRNMNKCLL